MFCVNAQRYSIGHLVVSQPEMMPDLMTLSWASCSDSFLIRHLPPRPRFGLHAVKIAHTMDHPEDLNGALSEPIDHSISFHEQLPHLRIGSFRYQPPTFGKCSELVHRQ